MITQAAINLNDEKLKIKVNIAQAKSLADMMSTDKVSKQTTVLLLLDLFIVKLAHLGNCDSEKSLRGRSDQRSHPEFVRPLLQGRYRKPLRTTFVYTACTVDSVQDLAEAHRNAPAMRQKYLQQVGVDVASNFRSTKLFSSGL